MNHFMLPLWNGEGLATPKYGTIAMEKLLEQVLAIGCKKSGWLQRCSAVPTSWG